MNGSQHYDPDLHAYFQWLRSQIARHFLMGQSTSAPTNRKQRRAAARKKK